MMNKQRHISDLLTDYVMGVLPSEQVRQIRAHIEECSQCRLELWEERQIGTKIWDVYASIPVPTEKQLYNLMPPIPKQRWSIQHARHLKAGLAVASFIIIITLTTIGFHSGLGQDAWLSAPSTASSTTFVTDTPTQSLVATPSAKVSSELSFNTPVPQRFGDQPIPALIPVPVATYLN